MLRLIRETISLSLLSAPNGHAMSFGVGLKTRGCRHCEFVSIRHTRGGSGRSNVGSMAARKSRKARTFAE